MDAGWRAAGTVAGIKGKLRVLAYSYFYHFGFSPEGQILLDRPWNP
jgi:hypothetical protein